LKRAAFCARKASMTAVIFAGILGLDQCDDAEAGEAVALVLQLLAGMAAHRAPQRAVAIAGVSASL
jgi:hypothetical protein